MRFELSRTLDAIEERLATDPLRTGGVVDVSEAVFLADLDGGRPATLLRLGLLVDALSGWLVDADVALYPVAERGLLAETELSSTERMVLRRWSDAGLVEILPAGESVAARIAEVSAATGQPVITRRGDGHALRPQARSGGAVLVPAGAGSAPGPQPSPGRLWQCPTPGCPSFGAGRRRGAQPPPHYAGGVPVCPRHGQRLTDLGPLPPSMALVVRIGGAVRRRFVVNTSEPVLVGRAPEHPAGVSLGEVLDDDAATWVSRRHVALDLRDEGLYATDLSTNGTVLVTGGRERYQLPPGQPQLLPPGSVLELFKRVELALPGAAVTTSADAQPSVMADAPTVPLRVPKDR